jgi:F-type H+-transporting ATPase subunit b
MEALGINLGFLILQIIVFMIVFLSLQAWVYKPMLTMMENRRKKIAQGMEDARVAAQARAAAEKEAGHILAEAHAQAASIVNAATERAERAALQIKADSEQNVEKERQAALAEFTLEREHILSDIRGEVAVLAMAAAQKLVGEALDETRQRTLIDEFFSGIKGGKILLLDDTDIQGASAEVTSAMPLSPVEQEVIRGHFTSRIGAPGVSFRVDSSILGGLVIKVGDRVLDGSVEGKLESLRRSLQ